jgi:hypothetical protein
MSTKINDTLHIKNFIDTINKADNSRQKNLTIDIEHAKRVRNGLTSLLLLLAELQANRSSSSTPTTDISMDGGDF